MRVSRHIAGTVVLAALAAASARTAAAETGRIVDDLKLATLDGKPERLVDRASGATVVVFLRAGQERSVEALRAIVACEASLGTRTRLVGVVSDQEPPAEVRAMLGDASAKLPVLVDGGDALYARLRVRTHPTLAFLDGARRVVALEPYHPLGSCEALRARVRRVLGEISDEELAEALAPADSELPGNDPLVVALRHVKLGRKLLAARSLAEAHRNARKSLELAPSAAAWTLEGEIFAAEGNCPEATRAFETALRLDARDARALAGKAACAR